MEQEAQAHAEVAAGTEAAPVMGHEVHLAAQEAAAAAEQQQLAAQHHHHQQHHHHHHQEASAALDVMAAGDQHQQLAVGGLADQAVAAALAAAAMGGGLSMAGLLAAPLSAAHASALMGTPTMGGDMMGGDATHMSGGGRGGPASIPRGQEGYSRKAKSLSLLCENFVASFGQVVNQVINLDNAASQLGVERRRIYDIVNVLESIKVVSKLQKNQYQWHGTAKLLETLQELHDEAQREMEEAKTMTGEDLASLGLDDRKEKSMSRLSQRFVQMFMLSKSRSLGLDEAARALLGGNEDQGQYKTKVRRLYDIANILSALKIIEKTHVGDKGKPGFRWLGPEGLQSIRPAVTTHHHMPAPTPTTFHLPGGYQAALASELAPLNMAGAAAAAGGMGEGAAAGGAEAAGVQVSLPAPASLYVGSAEQAAVSVPATAHTGGGGHKRPRRKSLRAREAEADTDEEEYVEEEEEYEEEEGDKRHGSEEAGLKRLKVEQPADVATQQQQAAAAAAAVAAVQQQQQQQQQHSGAQAGVAMFSELPIVMPTAGDAAAAAAMAAAMASGAYTADAMAAHAAGAVSNKPKVHPLLKFMELESQTEQGGSGMRRTMMGTELTARTEAHQEGQEAGQAAAWPTTAWTGMGMDWLTNPAMAAMYGGGFWPASAYAANMATAQRPAKPAGMTADGQPAQGAEASAAEAAPGAEVAAGGEQAAQDAAAAAAGGLPQVTFPYGMPTSTTLVTVPKPDGTSAAGTAPAEGQVVVGAPEGAAGAGAAQAADIASGQPVMDAQTAAAQQAAAAAGNPIAWQYWQYMYTNLYANAANAAQAVNPTVYSNMYANWTKKHDPGTGDGTGAEGPPQAIEGAPAGDAGMAAAAPGDGNALPVGAYPVDAPDMMGYAAAGHTMEETQHQVAEGVQHEHMMAQQEGVDVAVAPATNLVQQ